MFKKVISFYDKNTTAINIVFAIITLASAAFAIYTYYNPINSEPKLRVVLQGGDYLVKTGKKLKNLEIKYKGEDIRDDGLNLVLEKIKIVNVGSQPVINYGDEPFKLKVFNGELIGVEVIPNNENRSLSMSFKAEIKDRETVEFNKIVFNKNDAVILNLYILRKDKAKTLDFYILGKIAGQDWIPIMTQKEFEEDTTVLEDCWSIIKVLFELAFYVGIFLGILAILVFINEKLKLSVRRRKILKIYGYPNVLSQPQIALSEIYVELGKKEFLSLLEKIKESPDYINKEEELSAAFKLVNSKLDKPVENDSSYSIASTILKEKQLLVKNDRMFDEKEQLTLTKELLSEIDKTLQIFSV